MLPTFGSAYNSPQSYDWFYLGRLKCKVSLYELTRYGVGDDTILLVVLTTSENTRFCFERCFSLILQGGKQYYLFF